MLSTLDVISGLWGRARFYVSRIQALRDWRGAINWRQLKARYVLVGGVNGVLLLPAGVSGGDFGRIGGIRAP